MPARPRKHRDMEYEYELYQHNANNSKIQGIKILIYPRPVLEEDDLRPTV